MKRPLLLQIALTLLFTALGLGVMGYHPGAEDDGVYLAAIQSDLQPALYPHDAPFFKIQLQATVFDDVLAWASHATGASVYATELVVQFLALFVVLWACRGIAARLFTHPLAEWGGVAMVSAMFTLPVAGTALTLADQYLHPRLIATAFILLAVQAILARRRVVSIALLLAAMLFHPLMALFGMSFCACLALALWEPAYEWFCYTLHMPRARLALVVAPLGWVFEPPSEAWYAALHTRRYFFLTQWTWYEWLGALAPLLLFAVLWHRAHRQGKRLLSRVSFAVVLFGAAQFVFAIFVLSVPALVRLTPLQPMRFLHLIYLLMALLGGSMLAEHWLGMHPTRWLACVAVVNLGMFAGQRILFSSSPHFERPGTSGSNPWMQAFDWVRHNTPEDAFFALDPNYMAAPGEDFHSFRALAARSQMADNGKDAVVSCQVPELAPYWQRQTDATADWAKTTSAGFERLRNEFGVNWAVVRFPAPEGLDCRWHNQALAVCQIPEAGTAPPEAQSADGKGPLQVEQAEKPGTHARGQHHHRRRHPRGGAARTTPPS